MADPMLDSASKMVACAEALRDAADKMADRRMKALKAGEIDDDEFRNNVVREGFMRHQVSEILLKAMKMVVEGLQEEQSALESAIEQAKKTIQKIAQIRKALSVFATLIGLAESIALGKPQGILDALKAVKEETAGADV